MGFPGYRRSIRASLAYVGMAAATASVLLVLQSSLAAAARLPDAITVIPDSGSAGDNAITVLEGVSTGSKLVGKFTDTGNSLQTDVNCQELYVATIDWGDGSSGTGTVSCERDTTSDHVPTGVFDVTGSHAYVDSGPYNITVSVVDNSESAESSGAAVKTDTATVTDATLGVDFDNGPDGTITKVEGTSLTISVGFFDNNNAFPVTEGPAFDPGITATVDWGDGSAVQAVTPTAPDASCNGCEGDAVVTATHTYDALKPSTTNYTITVTAKDDGGSTATDHFTVNVTDAKLTAGTAKTFVAAAAQASSPVVASFTDAAGAQAKAADYTATIKWGDGTSSAGTAAQTAAGAFNVSGTHTYSSAGTKSLTITVTDEEGQTLSMTATATVPVLPTTGQPKTPLAPSLPLLPLIVMALGLIAIAGGVGQTLIRKARR